MSRVSSDTPRPHPGDAVASYGPGGRPPAGDTRSIVAFVLGIFSVFGLWVLGPVAIVVATGALRRIDAGEVPPGSRGLAVAARVLGIIGTVLLGVAVLVVVGAVLFLVTTRTTSGP